MNDEIKRMLKDPVLAYFKAMSWQLGETENIHKNLRLGYDLRISRI
jgi:hypothetical protein